MESLSYELRNRLVVTVGQMIEQITCQPSTGRPSHLSKCPNHIRLSLTCGRKLCGSRKYPYPSHGRFWFASPHPLGISVPRGSLMTPLPPGISTLCKHGFCCNIYYYNIHFQHVTLCYCSILFACLLSGLKCSVFHENLLKPSVVTFS